VFVSATGRRRAKLRRSPLTECCRAGNVTLRARAVAALPDRKPDEFQAGEDAIDEVEFHAPEFSGRVALVVRDDLQDGMLWGGDGGVRVRDVPKRTRRRIASRRSD
jgi:hypothetical protein